MINTAVWSAWGLFGVDIMGYVVGLDVDAIVELRECHGVMHVVFEPDRVELEADGANMGIQC